MINKSVYDASLRAFQGPRNTRRDRLLLSFIYERQEQKHHTKGYIGIYGNSRIAVQYTQSSDVYQSDVFGVRREPLLQQGTFLSNLIYTGLRQRQINHNSSYMSNNVIYWHSSV